jgi:hypothetical protein
LFEATRTFEYPPREISDLKVILAKRAGELLGLNPMHHVNNPNNPNNGTSGHGRGHGHSEMGKGERAFTFADHDPHGTDGRESNSTPVTPTSPIPVTPKSSKEKRGARKISR